MQFDVKGAPSTVRSAIIKDLKYTFKKVYFRSYDVDDKKIKDCRQWLSFYIFNSQML